MELPLRITFRDVASSPAIEADIREKAARLERFSERIMSCHVVVEAPHRHHHHGTPYHVRIDLAVPGQELIVNRHSPAEPGHADVYVAIRDAFDAARRQLEDHVRRQRDHGAVASSPVDGERQ